LLVPIDLITAKNSINAMNVDNDFKTIFHLQVNDLQVNDLQVNDSQVNALQCFALQHLKFSC
jgi:cytidylate kinase